MQWSDAQPAWGKQGVFRAQFRDEPARYYAMCGRHLTRDGEKWVRTDGPYRSREEAADCLTRDHRKCKTPEVPLTR